MTLVATSSPHVALLILAVFSSSDPPFSCSCSSFLGPFPLQETPPTTNPLFSAGYPIYSHFTNRLPSKQGGFNYGGTNASGQVPKILNSIGLIDPATPQSAYTKPSYADPSQHWELVFSDEFEVEGRTFHPGDDPYWEAVNLNYWETVSALILVHLLSNLRARATWSGTTRGRLSQRTGPFRSRSTPRIQAPTITCLIFQAWCV